MGSYIPNTENDKKEMMDFLCISSPDELFKEIPDEVLLKGELLIPSGKSEMEVNMIMKKTAAKNHVFSTILRGAGAYYHYIPSIVKSVISKEEFVTAYTPYQAEMSQGLLQAIFEYQTMICALTGMKASNASVYDGATAAAEAVAMCRDKKRGKVLISEGVHPQVIEVIRTYLTGFGDEIVMISCKNGTTDLRALKEEMNDEAACVLIQQPNFYGAIEPAEEIGAIVHQTKAGFIMHCNPISLGLLKTPGECGADIAVGEGQPLGMPLSYGGPYLGFMAASAEMMRKLPGRIVGQTTDTEGRRAYVLTLQAREQHIRREKAASNICSNQALCALTAAVYMSVMGPEGIKQAALHCMSNAHYLADELCRLKSFAMENSSEFFHEFTTVCEDAPTVLQALEKEDILGGLMLDDRRILWCVTEMTGKEELDRAVKIIQRLYDKNLEA